MSELEHLGQRDIMRTVSGSRFPLTTATPQHIYWFDIAHALSNLNRYGGHTFVPFSVGQHSVMAARMAANDGCSREEITAVLLHDSAEAYIGDIISPVKRWIYDIIGPREMYLLHQIFEAAGLQEPAQYRHVIEEYDAQMFLEEVHYFFHDSVGDPTWRLPDRELRAPRFRTYSPTAVRALFLRTLSSYTRHSKLATPIEAAPELVSLPRIQKKLLQRLDGRQIKDVRAWIYNRYILLTYSDHKQRGKILDATEEILDDLNVPDTLVKLRYEEP